MDGKIRCHVFQVVGWGKNIAIENQNSSTISDGAYFLSKDRAREFARDERSNYIIRELDGVLLSDVMDPENYSEGGN